MTIPVVFGSRPKESPVYIGAEERSRADRLSCDKVVLANISELERERPLHLR